MDDGAGTGEYHGACGTTNHARAPRPRGGRRFDGPAGAEYAHAVAVEARTYDATRVSWRRCLDGRSLIADLVAHRELVAHLVRRTVAARYRGSFLGVGWTVLQPLLMLAVYTYVFGFVFQARWGTDAAAGHGEFALAVFCGLIPFGVLAECAAAAPNVVVANASWVKRVVFPLELLPVVVVGSALVVAAVNALVLVAAEVALRRALPATVVLLPLVAVPTVLLALAISWFLAALGVFVRDTASVVTFLTQVLFFVTPIVYPAHAVPARFRGLVALNPLATLVEAWRGVALGVAPVPWGRLALLTATAAALALGARAVFVRSQRAFADVV
jgi:lipopolysaccharide transport system permease protein